MAYKLVEYAGVPRMKFSPAKTTLPGRKQVFRAVVNGKATGDVIACFGETIPGRTLLEPAMVEGRRIAMPRALADLRSHCRGSIDQLPQPLLALTPADQPYSVAMSAQLLALQQTLQRRQTPEGL
jgi:nicotinate phosphoribosyltransferase